MSDQSGPTLADDEAALARYAAQLADAVAAVVDHWLMRLVAEHAPQLAQDDVVATELGQIATQATNDLRELLALDIAEQSVGPLEILRRAVSGPNRLLAQAAIQAPVRDEFSRTNFPDDTYDLTPPSFAAIDPSLHEPGLVWGAAKAHVHLRRRREPQSGAKPLTVLALSADLMDRSKISAAYPEASFVRSVDKLVERAGDADLVLVDLGRVDDPAALSAIPTHRLGRSLT